MKRLLALLPALVSPPPPPAPGREEAPEGPAPRPGRGPAVCSG